MRQKELTFYQAAVRNGNYIKSAHKKTPSKKAEGKKNTRESQGERPRAGRISPPWMVCANQA